MKHERLGALWPPVLIKICIPSLVAMKVTALLLILGVWRDASAVERQVSICLPYLIVQIGTWPGPYSFPAHGVPQTCRWA
jgi:hypothetical protein